MPLLLNSVQMRAVPTPTRVAIDCAMAQSSPEPPREVQPGVQHRPYRHVTPNVGRTHCEQTCHVTSSTALELWSNCLAVIVDNTPGPQLLEIGIIVCNVLQHGNKLGAWRANCGVIRVTGSHPEPRSRLAITGSHQGCLGVVAAGCNIEALKLVPGGREPQFPGTFAAGKMP
jgi:hypothetical protein